MVKLISKISFLFVLLILLSIQGSTSLEQKHQIQSNQTQLNTQKSSQNLNFDPDFGKIPLYFVPNRGQVDKKALFYAKASRYTLWLTKEGLVFDSTRRIKKESTKSMRLSPRDINDPEHFKYARDVSRLVFINANRSPEIIPVNPTDHKVNYLIGNDKSKWRTDIQTSRAVLYRELYPNIDLKVYGIEKQVEYDFIVKPGGEVSDISFEYQGVEKTRIDKEGNFEIETKFGELEHAKPVCYQIIGGERVEVKAKFKKIENNIYSFRVQEYNRNYELIIDPLVLVYSTYLGGSQGDEGDDIAVDSEGAAYVTGYTASSDFPTLNPIQGSFGGGSHDIFITKVNSSGTALIYSTYLGGSEEDKCYGIGVDSEGAAYVAGKTQSLDFPTQNPIQGSNAGEGDAFITKINSSGSALIYSTYLGGSDGDEGRGIGVDSEGAAYVAGTTSSIDFPTLYPIQGSYAGGDEDAFITKVNSSGTALVYSTYLGGSEGEWCPGIAVDSEGAAYVTGITWSIDFPTQNPVQSIFGGVYDAFITKVNASGSAFIYSTYLGGSEDDEGDDIAVDSEGAAYVTGYTASYDFPTKNPIKGYSGGWGDPFITKVNASGSALIYSTYLGGSEWDMGLGITVGSEGEVYVTGHTGSANFPTKNPIQGTFAGEYDAFIAKVNASGSALIYSTYLGGSRNDSGSGIAVDSEGAAYVVGYIRSVDFPTLNPIQSSFGGGSWDVFIAKLSFSGTALANYSLIITAGSGGTTDPSPGNYICDEGTDVTIRAIPNSDYTFSGWGGDASGTTNPITITMDSYKSIKANFSATTTDDGDSEGKKGGCFIATSAYGSSLHPYVKSLRDFKDRYLIPTKLGRVLVNLYYKYSPFVANLIARHKALEFAIRISLLPLVAFSYSMLHLGPIITFVLLVFIFVLPIFLISFFWRKMKLVEAKSLKLKKTAERRSGSIR